jgi:hypothetical protein
LQNGTTCCNAYIEEAKTGLSPAMGTSSQIVVTAAAAVAHTASMKSKQSRAPPAVGISCGAVYASTRAGKTACVVDSVLLAACGCACECALAMSFPGMHCSRGSHVARYPTRHGIQWRVCYLHALAAEDWPRCRHPRSCPCLVGTTMRPLHERATRSSGTAIEYSHGVTLSERSHGVLCVLTWGYSDYSKRG